MKKCILLPQAQSLSFAQAPDYFKEGRLPLGNLPIQPKP